MEQLHQVWIKRNLMKGNFVLSLHAGRRARERIITEADIRACGRSAKKVVYQEVLETWKVVGRDMDGNKLTVVCAIRERLLIVTIF